VNLTVQNNFGNLSSIIQEIQVGNVPLANFTFSPEELRSGDTVTFDATLSEDVDGTIANYVWDFGDGSPVENSTGQSLTHAYAQKGVYWARLIVYDNAGLYNSTSQEIFVGKRPIVTVSFAPERPFAYETVTFNASLTHAGEISDRIAMLKWNFGDYNVTDINVSSSILSDPFVITHIYYGEGGIYTVDMIAFDNNGLYNSYAFEIDVQGKPEQEAPNYALYIGIAVAVVAVLSVAVIVMKRGKKRHRP
jgi:PKD repeat protein